MKKQFSECQWNMIENQAEVEVKKIEHLGLLAATAKKVGLIEKMDNLLPAKANNNVKISHGEAIFAMVLQGLGFSNNRMYLLPDFFSAYALDRIFSEGTEPEHFNEAVLEGWQRFVTNPSTSNLTNWFHDIISCNVRLRQVPNT